MSWEPSTWFRYHAGWWESRWTRSSWWLSVQILAWRERISRDSPPRQVGLLQSQHRWPPGNIDMIIFLQMRWRLNWWIRWCDEDVWIDLLLLCLLSSFLLLRNQGCWRRDGRWWWGWRWNALLCFLRLLALFEVSLVLGSIFFRRHFVSSRIRSRGCT